MRKLLIFLLFLTPLAAFTQSITFTPAQPPQLAKPAVLSIPSPSGSCTITGDAVPAVNLIVTCTFGTVKDNRTVGPFIAGTALTVQYNAGGHALTFIVNAMTLPINVTGTVDGGAAVGGAF